MADDVCDVTDRVARDRGPPIFYTGSWHQEWEQCLAAVWVICFSAAMTAIILYVVKFVCRGLRERDEIIEIGDVAIHDEEVYPAETFAERVSSMAAIAARLTETRAEPAEPERHPGERTPETVGATSAGEEE